MSKLWRDFVRVCSCDRFPQPWQTGLGPISAIQQSRQPRYESSYRTSGGFGIVDELALYLSDVAPDCALVGDCIACGPWSKSTQFASL
jgi:hypothetical protein